MGYIRDEASFDTKINLYIAYMWIRDGWIRPKEITLHDNRYSAWGRYSFDLVCGWHNQTIVTSWFPEMRRIYEYLRV